MSIAVTRTDTFLKPDQSRVLLRPFIPGDTARIERIVARIMSIPEGRVGPVSRKSPLSFPKDTKRFAPFSLNASDNFGNCC